MLRKRCFYKKWVIYLHNQSLECTQTKMDLISDSATAAPKFCTSNDALKPSYWALYMSNADPYNLHVPSERNLMTKVFTENLSSTAKSCEGCIKFLHMPKIAVVCLGHAMAPLSFFWCLFFGLKLKVHVQINQQNLTYMAPEQKQAKNALRTAFGADHEARVREEAGPKPEKRARSKHQITSLFHQAKMKVCPICSLFQNSLFHLYGVINARGLALFEIWYWICAMFELQSKALLHISTSILPSMPFPCLQSPNSVQQKNLMSIRFCKKSFVFLSWQVVLNILG